MQVSNTIELALSLYENYLNVKTVPVNGSDKSVTSKMASKPYRKSFG